MFFLCLFYIWWNFGSNATFIELCIAFLKRNIIFFQAVWIVCLQSCKASLVISLFSYLSFIFCHCSSILRILRIASLPKYIPVVVYSGSSSFTITGLIKFYIFSLQFQATVFLRTYFKTNIENHLIFAQCF